MPSLMMIVRDYVYMFTRLFHYFKNSTKSFLDYVKEIMGVHGLMLENFRRIFNWKVSSFFDGIEIAMSKGLEPHLYSDLSKEPVFCIITNTDRQCRPNPL